MSDHLTFNFCRAASISASDGAPDVFGSMKSENVWQLDPVRKLEHQSHFSSFSSLWTLSLFPISRYIPLYVLPNRPHSPPSFVFIVASSLT